ncbi:transferase 2, rSAM/selenodomain-associated [Malonomonas rubra DSM 5091]|uniref:Transferase 2, rSAM/selenodomain-associated n=1 Tax=Malonomonas rubra DSM 5091 TaxID=1122189 RepID=A0A1M6BRE0_MALRU|nr:TIGR04283 family arsenosugar biosynthesis glycosyltransferase [Malonomonas rubra]SHI51325.1 transferase 2, rSAM/selenodomain-associated [Malonomonas rubra DSM 5091]
MRKPELNIIVPLLNERSEIASFLTNMVEQQDVDYELIFVDGGSTDGSLEYLQQAVFPGRVFSSEVGRARQMNAGVQQAEAEWLLFLHIDSRFSDPRALRRALDMLQQPGSINLAGHFALKFRRREKTPSHAYYFYEWKARLGRPETIHGDQGFLLRKELFFRLNGFSEDMTVMEDTDFAERLREVGQWQLLPAEISTSARRFETEGLWQRQLLGALIMCFRDVGWQQFFVEAAGVYRQQNKADQLQIRPFFALVRQLLKALPVKERFLLWWRCGGYVRRHAWQLFFAVDAMRAFYLKFPPGQGSLRVTNCFEPLWNLLSDNLFGRLVATFALRCWFEIVDLWLRVREAITR